MVPTTQSGKLRGVEGEDDVRAIAGVTGIDITLKPGNLMVPPPEGARYLGFVYARGDSPLQVESVLRKAKDTLKVQLEG
jgi:hypothetical protein